MPEIVMPGGDQNGTSNPAVSTSTCLMKGTDPRRPYMIPEAFKSLVTKEEKEGEDGGRCFKSTFAFYLFIFIYQEIWVVISVLS